MFWNAESFFLSDSADKTRSQKLNMAGMWPWVPNKLLSGEQQKHTFSIKADSVHFFFEKINFLTAPAGSCCRCGQFDIGVAICVYDLQHLLISLARGMKYFHDVFTTLPIWRFSNILDLQHFHMFIINPMIHMANTQLGIEFAVFLFVEHYL